MSICGVTAGRGETARGFAAVPGSGVKIPLVLVNGERPGPSPLPPPGVPGGG